MVRVIVLALGVDVDENVLIPVTVDFLTAHLADCDGNHWVLLHRL